MTIAGCTDLCRQTGFGDAFLLIAFRNLRLRFPRQSWFGCEVKDRTMWRLIVENMTTRRLLLELVLELDVWSLIIRIRRTTEFILFRLSGHSINADIQRNDRFWRAIREWIIVWNYRRIKLKRSMSECRINLPSLLSPQLTASCNEPWWMFWVLAGLRQRVY